MKIKKKKTIKLTKPEKVYDLTISDDTPCFAVAAGVLSHNTKRWKSPIHTIPWACVSGDTQLIAANGVPIRISALEGDPDPFPVQSFDQKTKKVTVGVAKNVRKVGRKPVLKITLQNKEVITCTYDHKFLLKDGITWKRADKLTTNDELLDTGAINEFCTPKI